LGRLTLTNEPTEGIRHSSGQAVTARRAPGRGALAAGGRETLTRSLIPHAGAFVITAALLSVIQSLSVPKPFLLAERFLPGAGWIEVLLVASYAAWAVGKLLDPRAAPVWRRRLWTLFSLVFFTQLALGLAGFDIFLMTGKLHLPVPALILAGPLYRAERFFMPLLFLSTVLIVGPAWCSYLCYIGAWDSAAASRKRSATPLPRWRNLFRGTVAALVIACALLLRAIGAPPAAAAAVGAAFGLIGVAVMLVWSRRTGTMVHCVMWCPIGLAATVAGKLNPFRLRIDPSCTNCGRCTLICRYDAMRPSDLARGRPGGSCTLCGDCIGCCPRSSISYRFAGLSRETARRLFLVLVVSLHAVFLAVARI